MLDAKDMIERVTAILQIQGLEITIRKSRDWFTSRIFGLRVENDIIPVILRLASSRYFQTYVDIGAYVGDTIVPVSGSFPFCLAVEPSPESFERLNENLLRNSVTNCFPFQYALGERNGETALYYGGRYDNNSTLPLPGLRLGARIQMTTLDGVLGQSRLPAPFLLKLDVQGNELHVLRGAEHTLQADCSIVSEFWPYGLRLAGTPGLEYLQFMKERGFEAHNLRNRHIRWTKLHAYCRLWEDSPHVSTDIVFTKE